MGTQYRSAIFYHSPEQKATAEQVIAELERRRSVGRARSSPRSRRFEAFYPAEDYHQEYFARNADQPYCRAVVAPKVAKFRKHFLDKLKK